MTQRKYESEKIERVKADVQEKFLLDKKLKNKIFEHRAKIKRLVLDKAVNHRSLCTYRTILKQLRKEAARKEHTRLKYE